MMVADSIRCEGTVGNRSARVLALILLPFAILSLLLCSCTYVVSIPQLGGDTLSVAMDILYLCLIAIEPIAFLVLAIGATKAEPDGRSAGSAAAMVLFIILAVGDIGLRIGDTIEASKGWDAFVTNFTPYLQYVILDVLLLVFAGILLHWFRTVSNARSAKVTAVLAMALACYVAVSTAYAISTSDSSTGIVLMDTIITMLCTLLSAAVILASVFSADALKGFSICLVIASFAILVMGTLASIGTVHNAGDYLSTNPGERSYTASFLISYFITIGSIMFESVIFIFMGFSAPRCSAGRRAPGFIAAMILAILLAVASICISAWQMMSLSTSYFSDSLSVMLILALMVAQILMLCGASMLLASLRASEDPRQARTAAAVWSIAMGIMLVIGSLTLIGTDAGIYTLTSELLCSVIELFAAIVVPLVVCRFFEYPVQAEAPMVYAQNAPSVPRIPVPPMPVAVPFEAAAPTQVATPVEVAVPVQTTVPVQAPQAVETVQVPETVEEPAEAAAPEATMDELTVPAIDEMMPGEKPVEAAEGTTSDQLLDQKAEEAASDQKAEEAASDQTAEETAPDQKAGD